MNCHAAQRLLSAERDGALASRERAALEGHLAGCGACRRARATVAAAIETWRTSAEQLAVPDAERAWQDIQREIRTTASDRPRKFWGLPLWGWALPLTATAALVFAATQAPHWLGRDKPPQTVARVETARADFVEVGSNSSSMVYVDDKSGWLVVWAVNDKDKM